jgi:hypothetical protein
LRRILGNIGKPGLVLLSTPKESLLVRELDPGKWKLDTCKEFDGNLENCFRETSLHLSFTNYHVPVFLSGASGLQDAQVSVIESIISVRDSGVWVADANILQAVLSGDIHRHRETLCNHMAGLVLHKSNITSVGSWNDVLDCPAGVVVVKSHGNWVARLALLAVLLQTQGGSGRRITLCGPSVCWSCVDDKSFPSHIYIQ